MLRCDDRKEKAEETGSRRLLDLLGFCLFSLSQWRPTGQTEGVSDTYGVHPGIGVAVWLESKRRKGGKVSRVQEQFALVHEAAALAQERRGVEALFGAGVPAVVIGSLEDCERFVIRCGLAVRLPNGMLQLKPDRTAVYYEWARVLMEERERKKLARRSRKAKRGLGHITSRR